MRSNVRATTTLTVAAFLLLAISMFASTQSTFAQPISPKSTTLRAAHPEPDCPPGWVKAISPLNEDLGCINNTLVANTASSSDDSAVFNYPDDCPEGWVKATSPLNEDLGCVNNTLVANTSSSTGDSSVLILPDRCPEGWIKATSPLNPALGCIPNTIVAAPSAPVVVVAGLIGTTSFTNYPCPEGSAIHPDYVEYGCIPYGAGPWAE